MTQMEQALNDAGITQVETKTGGKTYTLHTYFDPVDYLDDQLTIKRLKRETLSTAAWFLDNNILQQAQSIVRDAWKSRIVTEATQYDDKVAFIDSLVGQLNLEKLSTGPEEGPYHTICRLAGLADDWHEYADIAANEDDRVYSPKSLIEQATTPNIRQVSGAMAANARAEAKKRSLGDSKKEDRLYNEYMTKLTHDARRFEEDDKLIRPAVLALLDYAQRNRISSRFDELPKPMQARLAEACMRALDMGKERCMNAPMHEFTYILDEYDTVRDAYADILVKKFNDDSDISPHDSLRPTSDRRAALKAARQQLGS